MPTLKVNDKVQIVAGWFGVICVGVIVKISQQKIFVKTRVRKKTGEYEDVINPYEKENVRNEKFT